MTIMNKAKSCPKLVPSKIYADFESNLILSQKVMKGHT